MTNKTIIEFAFPMMRGTWELKLYVNGKQHTVIFKVL